MVGMTMLLPRNQIRGGNSHSHSGDENGVDVQSGFRGRNVLGKYSRPLRLPQPTYMVAITVAAIAIHSAVACGNTSSSVFASFFASSNPNPGFSDFIQTMGLPKCPPSEFPSSSSSEMKSLCRAANHRSSIFAPAGAGQE